MATNENITNPVTTCVSSQIAKTIEKERQKFATVRQSRWRVCGTEIKVYFNQSKL